MKSLIFNLKRTIILFSVIALVSCEDKVQLKLDNKANRISVDAFLNNLREDQKIRLTSTDNYFSGSVPPPIIGAEVMVTDLTVNKKFTFVDQQNGNYVFSLQSSDTMIVKGHSYELYIRYRSYEYKANTSAKRSAPIEMLFFRYEEASSGIMGSSEAGNKLKMLAKDPSGAEPDFYWIKLYKNGKFYGQPQQMQLEAFNSESDGQYFNPDRWKTKGAHGEDTCSTGDRVRIEILGISRETYDFLSLGVKMSNNGGMFAVTPVNLPTNVYHEDKNTPDAVGLFSVSDVTSKEIVCP